MNEQKQKINREEFLSLLKQETGYNKSELTKVLDAMEKVLGDCIVDNIEVNINGLFRMFIVEYKGRVGINWKSEEKEMIEYPPTKKVVLSLSNNLRNKAKDGFYKRKRKKENQKKLDKLLGRWDEGYCKKFKWNKY